MSPRWGLLLAALASASFANGRWHLAAAAWLAPFLLLLYVRSQPPRRGLALAFAAQLVAFSVNWWGMIPVPGLWYFLVAGVYAAVYFLPFLVDRLAAAGASRPSTTLVFPTAWVACEHLLQRYGTPYGSWGSLTYTQVDFLPLLQLASLTGIAGVSFVITWSAAVAAHVWENGAPSRRARVGLAAFAAVLLGILAWGGWRLRAAPASDLLRVAALTPAPRFEAELAAARRALASAAPGAETARSRAATAARRLNDDLLERTRAEVRAGAELVVWSEHAARTLPESESALIARAADIAAGSGAQIVLGIGRWNPGASPAFENKLVWVGADGAILRTYRKARPIVGLEAGLLTAGAEEIAVVETERGRFAGAICHDLDFPPLAREAGRREALLLVAPSADWAAITPLHARMAIPRAVETGAALVRPAAGGLSLVVDPRGRILASQLDLGRDGNVLRAAVPLARAHTLYPRLGDAFAWLCLAASPLLLAYHRRRAPADREAAA